MLTAPYLVGWVMSIYWGYLIVKRTSGDHNDIKKLLNGASGAPAGNAGLNTAAGNRSGRD